MKNILYILLFLIVFDAHSQSIKLVRTDVDSSRSNFVTATYIFGIDVYAEEISRCTAISFILRWDQTNYITFSEAIFSDFARKGYSYITEPQVLGPSDARVYVGVLSGDSVGSKGFDNPKLIHLEFAVSQAVTNNQTLNFNFESIQAVVSTDSGGKIVNLENQKFSFNIHGFIDVWPGDANNDFIVNQDDMSTLSLYLKYGSSFKSMRSFKREPTSSIWVAQRALAWDTLNATYADCDGNGDVTITDMLVIGQNFLNSHSLANKEQNKPQNVKFSENHVNETDKFILPIKLKTYDKIKGFAGKISLPDDFDIELIVGINRGEALKDKGYFIYTISNREIYYAYITENAIEFTSNDIFNLVLKSKPNEVNFNNYLYILNENNNIYNLNFNITNVINENDIINYILIDNVLYSNFTQYISIYDLFGNKLYQDEVIQGKSISLEDFNTGIYFIKSSHNEYCTKFIKY